MAKFNLKTDRSNTKGVDWDSIGKEPVKIANIMATRNYGMFRFLDGNRDTKHFKKLVKSLTAIGILYQPILVNERNEIVEGQGRFLAMQELNLPVIYTVQKGIGIKECRYLNSHSTNWGIKDYVHSFAHGEDKKESYVYIEQLNKEFPEFGIRVVYSASASKPISMGGKMTAVIQSGDVEITELEYNRGRKVLSYLKEFTPYLKTISGRTESMYNALIYCYNNDEVDNSYLKEKFMKYYGTVPPIATVTQAVAELERIYNFNIRGGREQVFLKSDFERYTKANKQNKKG